MDRFRPFDRPPPGLSRLVVARRPFVSDAFLVGALKRIPLFLVSGFFFFLWVGNASFFYKK